MPTFNDGEIGSSVRGKINAAIEHTDLYYEDVAEFLAASDTFADDTIVRTRTEGFSYKAIPAPATGSVANAAPQDFEVLPGQNGKYNIMSLGADNTGATDVSALAQSLHDGTDSNGFTIVFPAGRYLWESEFTITKSNVKLEFDTQYSASTGAYIILGADLSTDSIIKLDEDENRVGFPTRGIVIEGLSVFGDDRAYTCEAAINIHFSDLSRISNCIFKRLKGSAIRSKRNVRGICDRIDTQQCGDAGKPVINIEDGTTGDNNLTQGANWSEMTIESNYGIGLYEGENTKTSNYHNFRFETAESTIYPHYVLKGENGNFTNFAQGRQDGATSATGQVECIGAKFANLEIAGDVNGQTPMVVTGASNSFVNISADGRPGNLDAARVFLDLGGNNNTVTNINSRLYGGIILSGLQNTIDGTSFNESEMLEMSVTGDRNIVRGHASHGNNATTGAIIEVSGNENAVSAPYVRNAATSDSVIVMGGAINGLSGPSVFGCESATAVEDTGVRNTLDGGGGLIQDAGKHGVLINDGEPLRVSGFSIAGAGLTSGTWNGISFEATANVIRGCVVTGNYINEAGGTLANGIFANDNGGTEYYRFCVVTSNVIKNATTGITFPDTLSTHVIANNVTP